MNIRVEHISSASNQKIKDAVKLRDSKGRKKSGLFIVEGLREASRALESGFDLHTVFVKENTDDLVVRDFFERISENSKIKTIFSVSENAYSKLVLRETTEKIVCVFRIKETSLLDVDAQENPVVLVLDGVEKPGNMGAIFRSCDGAGVGLIIITGNSPDIYSPQSIRASVGAIFNLKIVVTDHQTALNFLNQYQFKTFGAALTDTAIPVYDSEITLPNLKKAICMGTEASGLGEFWLKNSRHVIIPMRGISDSLNVSVAAAILAYEATKISQ